MKSLLFTELTLTEQEKLSGGGGDVHIKAYQKNKNKTYQKGYKNDNYTDQYNGISVG